MSIEIPPDRLDRNLGWLLENFVGRVPGATSAVLASRDGLMLAGAGLTRDQTDRTAALLASLSALGNSADVIFEPSAANGGAVRQIVIEHDNRNLFIMSAGGARPSRPLTQATTAQGTVGTLLGVFSATDADPGVIGHQMAMLIKSVDEHLLTSTRTSEPRPAANQ